MKLPPLYVQVLLNYYIAFRNMGGTWSGSQRQCELISRQRQQQSIIREIEAIEACIYCYIDSEQFCND